MANVEAAVQPLPTPSAITAGLAKPQAECDPAWVTLLPAFEETQEKLLAVSDTGSDRELVLSALDQAKDILESMGDDPVNQSLARAMLRDVQSVHDAVKTSRGPIPRSMLQRVNGCLADVSRAAVEASTKIARAHAAEKACIADAADDAAKAKPTLLQQMVENPVKAVTALMGVSEKKEAAPITALRPELDERDVKPGKIIDPKEVAAARADLDKAKKSGAGYREVNAAARRVARAESGGDLKKEDRKEEMIRNTASAERLVVLDKPIESATAITEATSRNAMDKLHESGVAGYLKRGLMPKELVRYFDLNGDGKVEFREFDRVRRDGADMSYQQVAALDGKKGWFDARTITEEEFLKAARAMASLSAITSQEMGRITAQNKNNRLINQNGDGEITINEIRVALNRAGMTVQSSDTNHNGKLEGAEVDLALLKVELGSRLQKGKDINPAMDRDGNGHVSMGEAIAGLKSKGITRADQIDTDGEFRAAMASPAAAKPVVGKPGHTKK